MNRRGSQLGRRRGFTLLELLVIMAIITALIGLITTAGTSAKRKAREFQARTMIATLQSALSMYHVDFGAYPADTSQYIWINLLADQTTYGSYGDWHGPYISFKTKDLIGTIPAASAKDPWGHAYHYSLAANPPYRIWSNGPNATDNNGGGDDVKSW